MRKTLLVALLTIVLGTPSPAVLSQGGDSFLPPNLIPITAENIEQLTVVGRLGLGTVTHMYWSPDETRLVFSGDRHYWTYDMTDLSAQPVWNEGYLDTHAEGIVCTPGSEPGADICRDILSNEHVWTWLPISGSLEFQWITPDRQYAVRDVRLAESETLRQLTIYDIKTGEPLYTYNHDQVWTVFGSQAFVAPSTWIYAGRSALWALDLQTGVVENLPTPPLEDAQVTLSPDGSIGFAVSRFETTGEPTRYEIVIWNVAARETLTTVEIPDILMGGPFFSADLSLLAWATTEGIAIWDLGVVEQIEWLECPNYMVHDIAFNADGSRIMSQHVGESVLSWNTETGEPPVDLSNQIAVGNYSRYIDLALNEDASILASSGLLGLAMGDLLLWDLGVGQIYYRDVNVPAGVGDTLFRPDGKLLVSGQLFDVPDLTFIAGNSTSVGDIPFVESGNGRFITWYQDQWQADREVVKIRDIDTSEVIAQLPIPHNMQNLMALNHDGSLLAVSGDEGIQIWDVQAQRIRSSETAMRDHVITDLSFFESASYPPDIVDLIIMTYYTTDPECTGFRCPKQWMGLIGGPETTTNGLLPASYFGMTDITNAQYIPSIDMIVLESPSMLQLWQAGTEHPLWALSGHTSPAFSGDGRLMATVRDGVIWLWGILGTEQTE